MEKAHYVPTELAIIKYRTEDVICTSNINYEEDELPISPNKP